MSKRRIAPVLFAVAASLAVLSGTRVAGADRTIEEASAVLLEESLASLGLTITNQELNSLLAFELQYALSEGIIDSTTTAELDIVVPDEDLPDEDLFGEDTVEEAPSTTSDASAPGAGLSDADKARLRDRFTTRLTTQTTYWKLVAQDWTAAASQSDSQFTTCLAEAKNDDESDICYFNELTQFQIAYARQIASNIGERRTAAAPLGSGTVALLDRSIDRIRTMLADTLEFLSEEELVELGTNRTEIEGLIATIGGPPSTGPADTGSAP